MNVKQTDHIHAPGGGPFLVGLSGGVDSATTAALLLEAGYEVHGVTLRLWRSPTEAPPGDPVKRAQAVARGLDISLTVFDLRERFYDEVVVPFVKAYAEGLTPNPCVLCNPQFKFAVLLEAADALGIRWLSTGHYARISHQTESGSRLLVARSQGKDQSYFLYRLSQKQLRRLYLPLSEIADKAQVRAIARRLGLPVSEQVDSQDLCFLYGGDYRSLVQELRPESVQPGPIRTEEGEILGQHEGLPFYTVGQRSGLGLNIGKKLYVLELRPEDNSLIVGPAARLERESCSLRDVVFTQGRAPASSFRVETRVRYRAPLIPARITLTEENQAHVDFDQPQRRLAPGQSVVFYRGEEVLGGGLIRRGNLPVSAKGLK